MRAGSWGGGHAASRAVAALVVLLAASLLLSAPALAISQRGHEFSFAFGSFADPAGVGVSATTGDVYVSDLSHKRVQQFEPVVEGERVVNEKYLREIKVGAPGAIAVDNSTEGEDPSRGDVYVVSGGHAIEKLGPGPEGKPIATIQAFQTGGGKSKKLAGIEGIAVDASGHLFVHESGGLIYRFGDAESNNSEAELSAAGAFPVEENLTRPGFAVDSNDDLYLGVAEKTGVKTPQGELLKELAQEFYAYRKASGEEGPEESEALPYTVAAKLAPEASKLLTRALDDEFSSAIAVNPEDIAANAVDEQNDVYVVNVNGYGLDKSSTVAQFAPEEGEHEAGHLIQRFGAPSLVAGDAITVDPATGAVFVADAGSGDVDLFQLEAPARPAVEGLSAESSPTLSGTETLSATVDPGGASTHYYFEYGPSGCVASSSCARTSAGELDGFAGQLASVSLPGLAPGAYSYRVLAENAHGKVESGEQAFTILASLGVLPDGRAWEMVSPPDKGGAEPEAIRKEGGLVEASPSGNAITYAADGPMPAGVSPEGNRVPEPTQVLSVRGSEGWSSQDITTPNTNGAGLAPETRWEYQLFSRNLALSLVDPFRSERGKVAQPPLSPPVSEAEKAGAPQENTIYLRDDRPIAPEASEIETYKHALEDGEKMGNAGYLALVTELNGPGAGFGREAGVQKSGIAPEAASPDLSHVVYRSESVNPGLYEWGEQHNQLISVLENGSPVKPGTVSEAYAGSSLEGEEPTDVRHAVSENGDRVFWTYQAGGGEPMHLEVRETGETPEPQTLQLDKVEAGMAETGVPNAVFQTASANGSKVFFTDGQRLTRDSGAIKGRPDLYVAELEIEGGVLKLKSLTDLTALRDEAGDVLLIQAGQADQGGGVIGASEDGSYVYFVANGALTPEAPRGYCPSETKGATTEPRPPGTTCNLYVRHYNETSEAWEPTKLVAVLSSEDAPDWGSDLAGDFTYMTSGVSPDGHYLAFMSDRSLTGYDNEDVSSKSPGERMDEEVFLYHVAGEGEPPGEAESLVCVSCNPSGARPTGVFDAGTSLGGTSEGLGLVVDRPEIWSGFEDGLGTGGRDAWLAGNIPGWTSLSRQSAPYQSRYLSNNGRLFFNSADALMPLKTPYRRETVEGVTQEVGVENVYEYEPSSLCGTPGGCLGLISSGESEHESAFVDASEGGSDVFFLTAQPLTPQDVDANFDIYDAHVCEPASPCTKPPEKHESKCGESEECQGSAAQYEPGPPPPPSGSSIFSGAGNLVLPSHAVLPEKKSAAPVKKRLTRAQRLKKALKACRKDKKKSKRLACEKQARKKYGPVKKKAKKSGTSAEGAR